MKPQKRLFLGLSLFLFSLLLIMLLSFGYILQRPGEAVLQSFLIILVTVLALGAVIILTLILGMVIILVGGRYFPLLNGIVEKAVVFIFPLVLHLGKMLRIAQDKVQRSFIEINNKLLEARGLKVDAKDLLILLPHCLQEEACPHKITRDPYNCRRCGRCPVDNLLSLAEDWNINVQIVTGGTLARQAVKKMRPRCIIAVACERDLSSGIIDSFPLPVFGLLNERPYGPCYNTYISKKGLETVLGKLVRRCESVS